MENLAKTKTRTILKLNHLDGTSTSLKWNSELMDTRNNFEYEGKEYYFKRIVTNLNTGEEFIVYGEVFVPPKGARK